VVSNNTVQLLSEESAWTSGLVKKSINTRQKSTEENVDLKQDDFNAKNLPFLEMKFKTLCEYRPS
jgi:hypothetical protein